MSQQLNAINQTLETISDTLATSNTNIRGALQKLETAVNREEGNGIKGKFYNIFDSLKITLGSDPSKRIEAKEHLLETMNTIQQKSKITQKLLKNLTELVNRLDKKKTVGVQDDTGTSNI
tara:strand:+ start:540 stop:899 length:360 start_codon:yes stop_codon:yes gene_type:complete